MNITIPTHQFNAELTAHHAVIDKKNTIPVVGCVSLKADGDTLTLESNSLERGLQSVCPVTETLEPGHVLVPGAQLTQIVKALPGQSVRLMARDTEIEIRSGAASFTLPTLDPEDFPDIITFGFKPLCTVSGAQLHALLDPTLFAVSSDESRYALNGVLWEVTEDTIKCIATNGHRLQAARTAVDGVQATGESIIPSKAGADLLRFFGAADAVQLSLGDHLFSARAGKRVFVSRLIDAQFPDYRAVIPKQTPDTHVMRLDRSAWIAVLRRVALLSGDDRRVKLVVEQGQVTLSAHDPNIGGAVESVACEYAGEGLTVGYNAKYLLEALNAMQSDRVEWQTFDSLSPGKITPVGDTSRVSIVMPMRV